MNHSNHMHNHTKNSQEYADIKVISQKLQQEVDHILGSIDDKAIFAEFREDQILDLHAEGQQEIIHSALDERISIGSDANNNNSSGTSSLNWYDRHTDYHNKKHLKTHNKAHNKSHNSIQDKNIISLMFYYLFKRFEY